MRSNLQITCRLKRAGDTPGAKTATSVHSVHRRRLITAWVESASRRRFRSRGWLGMKRRPMRRPTPRPVQESSTRATLVEGNRPLLSFQRAMSPICRRRCREPVASSRARRFEPVVEPGRRAFRNEESLVDEALQLSLQRAPRNAETQRFEVLVVGQFAAGHAGNGIGNLGSRLVDRRDRRAARFKVDPLPRSESRGPSHSRGSRCTALRRLRGFRCRRTRHAQQLRAAERCQNIFHPGIEARAGLGRGDRRRAV